jgi:hypothetical protein
MHFPFELWLTPAALRINAQLSAPGYFPVSWPLLHIRPPPPAACHASYSTAALHGCTQLGGRTIDHPTYLVPKGAADIFFPTDFSLLQRLCGDAVQHAQHGRSTGAACQPAQSMQRTQHMKTADFMLRFAKEEAAAARTRSGYNPLLEDYTNTAFFVASS